MAIPESAGLGGRYLGSRTPLSSRATGAIISPGETRARNTVWSRPITRGAKSWARVGYLVLPALLPLAVLGVWGAVVGQHIVSRHVLVSPLDVLTAFGELWSSGELRRHLSRSLARLVMGFAIGGALGLTIGIAMGVSERTESYIGPTFHAVRQIPSIALIPAFILILGVDESLKIVLVAKASLFPIALAALHGVKQISRAYLEVASVHRVPRAVLLWRLVIPSATPPIVAGARIALGRSWLILVASELMAADSGVGQMMEMGRQMFRMDVVMVGVLLTGGIGLFLDGGVRAVERLVGAWRRA